MYDLIDINQLLHVIEKMRTEQAVESFVQVFEKVEALESADAIYATLKNVTDKAALNGEAELFELLHNQMTPTVNELMRLYRDISVAVAALDDIDEKLRMQAASLCTYLEKSVVHISADTTANVGDQILVKCLRDLVEQKTGAVNWSSISVRNPVNANYIEMCNRSKAIVLGGGGLFLKDTNPNEISGWQWACSAEDMSRIDVPLYVMGVGYNRFRGQDDFEPYFTESINTIVEKSAFFGVRNHGSIRAIQSYLREDLRDKVVFHPCATTVISKLYQLPERHVESPFIALNCAFDREELRFGDKKDEIMLGIARVLKQLSSSYVIKCYAHCSSDAEVCRYLDAVGVGYELVELTRALTEEEYLRYFTEPELVLAIRGHAQMIPFGCITPTVSMISHDKLAWFLEDIEHPEWGVEVLDEQFEEKLLEKSLYMLNNREKVCEEIILAQEQLWDVMQNNLKQIQL